MSVTTLRRLTVDPGEGPSDAELYAIELQSPVIEAELDLLDAELALLDSPAESDAVARVRQARLAVLTTLVAQVDVLLDLAADPGYGEVWAA
ncbi:MAG: DUF6284 family protein [Micromonosporaceae bacterium]